MSQPLEIPDFGQLLQSTVAKLPANLVPALLSGLEQSAAGRYRGWADASSDRDEAQGMLACAAREEEIAERVAKLFPVSEADGARVAAVLPEARRIFLGALEPHALSDQYRIQASAERQGARAWRGLASAQTDPAAQSELETCAQLEETSAAYLEGLLASS